jgi:hypothetical protein
MTPIAQVYKETGKFEELDNIFLRRKDVNKKVDVDFIANILKMNQMETILKKLN